MNLKPLMILFAMVFCLMSNNCCVSSDANTISRELKTIQKEIPLPFHDDLVKKVNEYESNPLPPLFTKNERFLEKELQTRDMPLELKYLPVSLTKMQPDYQNRERCGVWALPTLVGLRYGLTINDRLDERFVVEASTRAALDYLAELQQKYNDWWHSILAFASSPNALQHAMTHSDKTLEVWDFYDQKLIPESHVICDFIACVYAYHNHGDTTAIAATEEDKPVSPHYSKHIVKKGETLGHIAIMHHVTVSEIQEWNHLEGDLIRDGQELIIKK